MSLEDMVAAIKLRANGSYRPLGLTAITAVEVLGRVDELTDGTGGSVDAVTEAKSGPYRKSRLKYVHGRAIRPVGTAPVYGQVRALGRRPAPGEVRAGAHFATIADVDDDHLHRG